MTFSSSSSSVFFFFFPFSMNEMQHGLALAI